MKRAKVRSLLTAAAVALLALASAPVGGRTQGNADEATGEVMLTHDATDARLLTPRG